MEVTPAGYRCRGNASDGGRARAREESYGHGVWTVGQRWIDGHRMACGGQRRVLRTAGGVAEGWNRLAREGTSGNTWHRSGAGCSCGVGLSAYAVRLHHYVLVVACHPFIYVDTHDAT